MKNTPFTSVRRWLHLVAMAAAVAGPAQAAVYNGVWDPAYGAEFPGLGWSGSVRVFVPDGCVPSGPGIVTRDNYSDCDNGAIVEAASVRFFDVGDTSNTLATLTFDASSIDIWALQFNSGVLSGLETDTSSGQTVPVALPAHDVAAGTEFFLSFTFGYGFEQRLAENSTPPPPYSGPVLDWRLGCSTDSTPCQYGSNDRSIPFTQPLTFQPVPVPAPGTLALAALGLLALVPRRWRVQPRHRDGSTT